MSNQTYRFTINGTFEKPSLSGLVTQTHALDIDPFSIILDFPGPASQSGPSSATPFKIVLNYPNNVREAWTAPFSTAAPWLGLAGAGTNTAGNLPTRFTATIRPSDITLDDVLHSLELPHGGAGEEVSTFGTASVVSNSGRNFDAEFTIDKAWDGELDTSNPPTSGTHDYLLAPAGGPKVALRFTVKQHAE